MAEARDTRISVGGQAAADAFMEGLAGDGGPLLYTYPAFVSYLSAGRAWAARQHGPALGGELADTMEAAADGLLARAGEAFLADGRAFVRSSLRGEFPELSVFRLSLDDAFAESPVRPGIRIETARFASLRSLSRMRREIRRTGLAAQAEAVEVVAVLLGLGPPGRPAGPPPGRGPH